MFETAMIPKRSAREGASEFFTLPVSVALHTLLLSLAVVAAVWNVTFPAVPPLLLERLITSAPVPSPVPAPKIALGSPEKRVAAEMPSQPAPVTAPAEVSPDSALTSIPSVSTTGDATVVDGRAGDPDGIPGGDPNGDVNGVPGGIPGGQGGSGVGAPLPVTGDVKAPFVLERIAPLYPEMARRIRKQGSAVVECIIDRRGTIREVRIVAADFPPFGEAAVVAVRKWRFKPGTLHGQPVDTIFQLTITFRLQ